MPQPPPPFEPSASDEFDPPLLQPKLLASGRTPQPPASWCSVGEVFDPPVEGTLRYLATGRLPRLPPGFDPHADASIEWTEDIVAVADGDEDDDLDNDEEAERAEESGAAGSSSAAAPPALAAAAAVSAPAPAPAKEPTQAPQRYRIKKRRVE